MKYFSARNPLYMSGSMALFAFFVPAVVFAQDIETIIGKLFELVDLATPIAAGLALLFFFWGVALYILNEGNAEKKGQGRSIMLWGVIAMFVIFSIFGLVKMLQNTFDVTYRANPTIPKI